MGTHLREPLCSLENGVGPKDRNRRGHKNKREGQEPDPGGLNTRSVRKSLRWQLRASQNAFCSRDENLPGGCRSSQEWSVELREEGGQGLRRTLTPGQVRSGMVRYAKETAGEHRARARKA